MIVIRCVLFLVLLVCETFATRVVCYFYNRSGHKIAPPENLNPLLCSHINYAFVVLQPNGTLIYEHEVIDINLKMYQRVVDLKKLAPNLKVLLSIGSTPTGTFSTVAANSQARTTLVESVIHFLETYHFDGIDVDWEQPNKNDSVNFAKLLKDLKEALSPRNWILSVAVMPIPSEGYNIGLSSQYVDMINLMTYNFYGPWSGYTGQNSPLYKSSIESPYEKRYLNLNSSVTNWIREGAPKEKINAGLAFYGRTYLLTDPERNGLHSPFSGPGSPATPTYRQICNDYSNWTFTWDDEQKNYYGYQDNKWISLDEIQSLTEKAKYIAEQELGGAMIWHIGGDDIFGDCRLQVKQILLNTINSAIYNVNKEKTADNLLINVLENC